MTAPEPARASATAGRYLTFRLDAEVFGVPILDVREIIELQEIAPVPRTSPWVRGVVNLRGRILPVVDPKVRFGLAPVERSELTVILVLQAGNGKPFGVLVDEVLEVQPLDEEHLAEPPALGPEHAAFVAGMGKSRDGLVFLLHTAALSDT